MASRRGRPIGAVDTIWLDMDRPDNLMVVTSVVLLDRPPDGDAVERLVRERVLERYPVFRQRPVPGRGPLGRPRWVDDEAFDLRRHLHRVTLPRPGTDAQLQAFVETRLPEPFDRRHPLWEAHLVDGHAAGSALVVRTHHALADGLALARVLLELTDPVPDDGEASPHPTPGDGAGITPSLDISEALPDSPDAPTLSGLASAGVALVGGAAALARESARTLATRRGAAAAARFAARTAQVTDRLLLSSNPANPFDGAPRPRKRVVWTAPRPLEGLRRAGRLADATLNDVLMSAVAGALHTYQLDARAEPVDLLTMVPVNVRPLDEPVPAELGNRFALVFLRYPSASRSTLERLVETKRRMDWIKHSPEAAMTYALITLIGRTTPRLERLLVDFFADKAIGVTTNVAGPRSRRCLAGSTVTGVLGWVPGSGRHTVGVCVFTYAGEVRVGLMTDASVVPRPEVLLAACEDELDRLSALGRLAGEPGRADAPVSR
jgi:diacylglycerol O-acyltransferase